MYHQTNESLKIINLVSANWLNGDLLGFSSRMLKACVIDIQILIREMATLFVRMFLPNQ